MFFANSKKYLPLYNCLVKLFDIKKSTYTELIKQILRLEKKLSLFIFKVVCCTIRLDNKRANLNANKNYLGELSS